MNDILDEIEVAALLACEPSTVLALARTKTLPGVKLGRSWRFPREALMQVVNRLALDHARPTAAAMPTAVAHPPAAQARKMPPVLPSLSH